MVNRGKIIKWTRDPGNQDKSISRQKSKASAKHITSNIIIKRGIHMKIMGPKGDSNAARREDSY